LPHPTAGGTPEPRNPPGRSRKLCCALCNSTPTQVHQTEIPMPKEANNLQQWQFHQISLVFQKYNSIFYESQNIDVCLKIYACKKGKIKH
jgi:hypothetical protein